MKKAFKLSGVLLFVMILTMATFAPHTAMAQRDLLVPHHDISGQLGFWQMSFDTAGSARGSRMNTFYRNQTGSTATVRVERLINDQWHLVQSFTVTPNSERTSQHSAITLNAPHRVTIQHADGSAVRGNIGIRQTALPL